MYPLDAIAPNAAAFIGLVATAAIAVLLFIVLPIQIVRTVVEKIQYRLALRKERPMKFAPDHICPRCGGDVPDTEHKGQWPGALSRTDNETEICSACGTAEAMEQFESGGLLTPQTRWLKSV